MNTLLMLALAWSATAATDVIAPETAKVYFVHLKDGDVVTSPFKVVFGLIGMGVAPAGVDPAVYKHVGHHHLFINSDITEQMSGHAIPSDNQHLHFGNGQTETVLSLDPGTYTLRLVVGDPYHRIHQTVVASERITIQVQESHHED